MKLFTTPENKVTLSGYYQPSTLDLVEETDIRMSRSRFFNYCAKLCASDKDLLKRVIALYNEDRHNATFSNKYYRAEQKRKIKKVLKECRGNKTKAAEVLEISRNTLINRMDKLGIKRNVYTKGRK